MKDTFYFSHDYNARTDPKIKRLMAKHGMTGYGIYWAIIEDLYNNANALQTDCESIAYDLRVDSEIIKSIIFDFDLFKIDGEIFSSLSIQRRLDDRNEKSEKARKSAEYRWNKKLEYANAMRTHSDGNAIKERKGKESKRKEKKEFVAPSVLEVQAYFSENGWKPELGTRAYNHYHPEWKNSQGKKVLNWKQTMRTVWMDESKNLNMKMAAPKINGQKIPVSVNIYECLVKYNDGTSLILPKAECKQIIEEYNLDQD